MNRLLISCALSAINPLTVLILEKEERTTLASYTFE